MEILITRSNPTDELKHAGKKGMKWGYNDGKRNGKRTADDELQPSDPNFIDGTSIGAPKKYLDDTTSIDQMTPANDFNDYRDVYDPSALGFLEALASYTTDKAYHKSKLYRTIRNMFQLPLKDQVSAMEKGWKYYDDFMKTPNGKVFVNQQDVKRGYTWRK